MSVTAIMIDQREPKWIQELSFGELPKAVTLLESGDLMLACSDGNTLLIERKTSDDFLGSIKSGRMFEQAARMLDQSRWSYVVITGTLECNPSGYAVTGRGVTEWHWSSVQGALATLQELGVFISHLPNEADFETWVLSLGKRERKPELMLMPTRWPRYLTPGETILASLPGIGEERLQALIDYCGTPGWALVALTDADTEIPEIPRNVKAKVRAALGLKDADQLAIITDNQNNEILAFAQLGSQ